MKFRRNLAMRNHTIITTFILVGLTDDPNWQTVIFLFLFLTYVLSVTGNLTIILLTLLDPHHKTPMYFFLWNFSFLEMSLTSVCIPRYLVSILTMDKTIYYDACAVQIFFAIFLGASEFFLLASMSYDCYVAICKPLHYTTVMSSRVCTKLVIMSQVAGLLTIFPGLIMGLKLGFCDANIIDHFYCDCASVLKLFCTVTGVFEMLGFISAMVTLLITLALVILSYAYILRTILKIPSAQQRKRAFSTCSSHIIVVSTSHGSYIFTYMLPSAEERVALNKGAAVVNLSLKHLF
ncbi:olfactory receptor 6C76-like [Loxodonta africana]|uniref:olfactory receptor 6C76-like n=1 Tax=Loxodonta africana TaxID=9785 RepID=UPI000C812DE5|nr:olfactory receptor 6C76-like [Loxodonta africana]